MEFTKSQIELFAAQKVNGAVRFQSFLVNELVKMDVDLKTYSLIYEANNRAFEATEKHIQEWKEGEIKKLEKETV